MAREKHQRSKSNKSIIRSVTLPHPGPSWEQEEILCQAGVASLFTLQSSDETMPTPEAKMRAVARTCV